MVLLLNVAIEPTHRWRGFSVKEEIYSIRRGSSASGAGRKHFARRGHLSTPSKHLRLTFVLLLFSKEKFPLKCLSSAEVKFKSPRWDSCLPWSPGRGKTANLVRDGYGHVGGSLDQWRGSFNLFDVFNIPVSSTKRWKKRRKCPGRRPVDLILSAACSSIMHGARVLILNRPHLHNSHNERESGQSTRHAT